MGSSSSKSQKKNKLNKSFSRSGSSRKSKRDKTKNNNVAKTDNSKPVTTIRNEINANHTSNNKSTNNAQTVTQQFIEHESLRNGVVADRVNTSLSVTDSPQTNHESSTSKVHSVDSGCPSSKMDDSLSCTKSTTTNSIGAKEGDGRLEEDSRDDFLRHKANSSSLVRSVSNVENLEVEPRSPPVRRLSVRESTEFRRKYFYQQMLSNKSSFDSVQSLNTTEVTNNITFERDHLKKIHGFYNHTSSIKQYDLDSYPELLRPLAESLQKLENQIVDLTQSELTVMFPTIKDGLHNLWMKVFSLKVNEKLEKEKKLEMITRVKNALDYLNSKYLNRKLLFIKQ